MKNTKWWTIVFVVGLLGLMAVLAVLSMKDDSATVDEVLHIAAGYTYLTTHEYRLNPEHPPLVKDMAALPLLFLNLSAPYSHPSWTQYTNDQWGFGRLFFYHSGNNPDQILFWSRLPIIGVLLLFGLFLFWWSRELGGLLVAFLVLFFFTFSPTFLAHGRLVTTDVGAAFGVALATYFYIKLLREPSWKRGVGAGFFLGIALLVKFSTLVLLPYFVALTFLWLVIQPKAFVWRSVLPYVRSGGIVVMVSILLVSAVYWFHIAHYPFERQVEDAKWNLAWMWKIEEPEKVRFQIPGNPILRPLGQYALGSLMTVGRASHNQVRYFLGELQWSGTLWYYFPVLYLTKVPLALHILTLFALTPLFFFIRRSLFGREYSMEKIKEWALNHFTLLALSLFILLYMVSAMASSLTIGIRHILPIFPFVYLLVAIGLKQVLDKHLPFFGFQTKCLILALLFGWYAISSMSTFPYYLSYYNELAGGVENGYKVAVDSNYDWGQDAKRLAKWVEAQGVDKVYVDYFGGDGIDPEYYLKGRYIPWRGSSLWEFRGMKKSDSKDFPKGNYLAVSATFLQGGSWRDVSFEKDYAWLDAYTPVARPGPSIFVYYIK